MIQREIDDLKRENDYLKLRNAQLQRDLTCLEAEGRRLRQELERHRDGSLLAAPGAVS